MLQQQNAMKHSHSSAFIHEIYLEIPTTTATKNIFFVWNKYLNHNHIDWTNVNGPEEKATKYRLTIKDIQPQESGTYTCTSPRGLTNSIAIMVTSNFISYLLSYNFNLIYLDNSRKWRIFLYNYYHYYLVGWKRQWQWKCILFKFTPNVFV